MPPKRAGDLVPPGVTRRKGVTTRSLSGLAQYQPPRFPRESPPSSGVATPQDDPAVLPSVTTAAAGLTPATKAEDASRTAAVERTLAETERALADEQTTVAELTRRLQREKDFVAQLRRTTPDARSVSGSTKPPRSVKKEKAKARKEPIPKPVKKEVNRAELLAGIQALLHAYGEQPAREAPEHGRRARKGHRRGRRDDAPPQRRASSTTSQASLDGSSPPSSSSSSSSSSGHSTPPTPPSPPTSPSDRSNESTSEDDEVVPIRRRHRKVKREDDEGREVYDPRIAVQAPNRRYRRLLSYKTHFLVDTRLAYPLRLVKKAHKLNKCLDGPFQGQPPFSGKDPLGICGFLSTFKRACDAAGASHGQALPLLSFRLAGAAKQSFVSAASHSSTRDRYAIRTYGDAVNWLLQKNATPDKLNEAYTEIISAPQEQEEAPRTFGERVERMCDRLDGLFSGGDIVDTFINGLHEAIKAHVLTFQMTKNRVSLPEAITTAQIYWTGIQKLKVDMRRHIRNTTTPIRVGAVSELPPDAVDRNPSSFRASST